MESSQAELVVPFAEQSEPVICGKRVGKKRRNHASIIDHAIMIDDDSDALTPLAHRTGSVSCLETEIHGVKAVLQPGRISFNDSHQHPLQS